MELLQVRVQSLSHMLALQEEELTRKVGPSRLPGLSSGAVAGVLPSPTSAAAGVRHKGHPFLLPQKYRLPPSHVQIQPSDALESEFPKKCHLLLRRWRERVFVLMVQLKAQDLEHRNSMKGLRDQVRGSVSHHSTLGVPHNDDSCSLGDRHVLGMGPGQTRTCSPGALVLKEDD